MSTDIVTTGVDELLNYLREKDKVPMQDAATALDIPVETIQAWVDFLVEEKIIGIEYKFTKPFIYLNAAEERPAQGTVLERDAVSIEQIKREFEEHAREKKIPQSKIQELWLSHIREALTTKKNYFVEKAKQHNADDTEHLWEEYQSNIIIRARQAVTGIDKV